MKAKGRPLLHCTSQEHRQTVQPVFQPQAPTTCPVEHTEDAVHQRVFCNQVKRVVEQLPKYHSVQTLPRCRDKYNYMYYFSHR